MVNGSVLQHQHVHKIIIENKHTMKTFYTFTILLLPILGFSQVILGDNIGTATDKTSVLLEYAAGQNKGIILPYVRTLPTSTLNSQALVGGSILLDATVTNQARVKYYNGTSWVDLSSGNNGDISSVLSSQPNVVELSKAKAIIGANSSSADGVLVLESNTKAMVLPMVSNVNDIPSPAPGMMVFINKTGAKRLAVYNGSKWTFWKP